MRKSLAAAAMAASLAVGGAAGIALYTPTLSGAQSDETTREQDGGSERPVLTDRLREQLQPLVDNSTVTAEQADAVAEHLAGQVPLFRGRHGRGFGADFGAAVLDVLGIDAAELREQLASGQSLADVAEAQGVDVQAVIDAVLSAHQERLAEAVEAGRITQEQADERAEWLREHAEALVERTFEPGGRRHGPTGGPRLFDDRTDS